MNKKKKLFRVLIIIIFIIIIGTILYGKYVADQFLNANVDNDTKDNSIKQLAIWNYNLDEFKSIWSEEEILLNSYDGTEIFLYKYSPNTDSKGNVIIVHGQGGDHISVAPLTQLYLENGYTVFAPDQRASGNSTYTEVSFGARESKDIESIVEYIALTEDDLPLILHGQSMGAATLAIYASKHSETFDYLILDSVYESLEYIVREIISEIDESIVDFSIVSSNIYMKLFNGFTYDDSNVLKSAERITVPTLFIQSAYDEIAPKESGEKIFNSILSHEKKYLLLNSEHVKGIIDFRNEYSKEVLSFIGK